ncbi:ABC transporter permease [Gemmatimonadota bacterium]
MWLNDLRLALRQMIRNPGITIVIILTLAIGIGANTAMFSTINAALFRSLPFEDPEELVVGRKTRDGNLQGPVSGYDYLDFKEQNNTFKSLSACSGFTMDMNITRDDGPERVRIVITTWNLFNTLGVEPGAGRFFLEEEGTAEHANVVVISNEYWQRRYAGSPDAMGKGVTVNDTPYTIIGVLPAEFNFLFDADVWVPTFREGPLLDARRWHNLLVLGRLKDNVPLEQAQADVDIIAARLAQEYPESNEGKGIRFVGLHDYMVEGVRTSLLLLMGTVLLVLLIACGNVAGLLLARGQGRLSEMAVRSALGGERKRLVGQLLTESMLSAFLAGGVGIFFAYLFQVLILRLLPIGSLGISEPGIDGGVLLFALVASVVTGLIFGIVPALRGTSMNLTNQLKGGQRSTEEAGSSRLRSGMVVAQVALSIMLLIGAGLLIRSLGQQARTDLGFQPANLLVGEIQLPASEYAEADQRIAFFSSVKDDIEARPGVHSVSLINMLPVLSSGNDIYVWTPDDPPASSQDTRTSYFRVVFPDYFETMGIEMKMGRDFNETDAAGSPRTIIISQEMVDSFFPDQNPIGQQLVVDMGELVTHKVIGVVDDVLMSGVRSEPYRTMYMAYAQVPREVMEIAIRTSGNPESLVEPIREMITAKNRNVLFSDAAVMSVVVDESLADYRVITSSLSLFSLLALLLTAIGLYGVLAYYVSQRTNEIGIRKALGATENNLVGMIVKRGLLLVGIGLVLGIAGAFLGTRPLRDLIFGVGLMDTTSYLGAAIALLLVTLLACFLPAFRASRVDPIEALRTE